MSIFKDTIPDFLIDQLNNRSNIVNNKRSDQLPLYFAKIPWVKFTSFVNYNGSPSLAQEYILMGGTLYNGNLTKGFNQSYESTQLGYRPKPGIYSVEVKTETAYGSLRSATIQYKLHSVEQLSTIEKLFQRPGYATLLEWGWSKYINGGTVKNFDISTINCFGNNLTEDNIYSQINQRVKNSNGNYDALLGFIKNFNWRLNPDGSYDCITYLISRGEVISTIKLSSKSYVLTNIINNNQSSTTTTTTTPTTQPPTITNQSPTNTPPSTQKGVTDFNLIFSTIQSYILSSGSLDTTVSNNYNRIFNSDFLNYNYKFTTTSDEFNTPLTNSLLKNNLFTNNSAVKSNYNSYYSPFYKYISPSTNSTDTNSTNTINNTDANIPNKSYIRLPLFLCLIQYYFMINNDNSDKTNRIVNILIPYDDNNNISSTDSNNSISYSSNKDYLTLCGKNAVSVDISKCVINNSYATEILSFYNTYKNGIKTDTNNTSITSPNPAPSISSISASPGFSINGLTSVPIGDNITTPNPNSLPNYVKLVSGGDKTSYRGIMGNIYVCIENILDIYASLLSDNGVDFKTLLERVMSDVNYSLGQINTFKIFSKNNTIQIIDVNYLESSTGNGSYASKKPIDLFGLKSVLKQIQIESQIFESQATMIAIASGNKANVGDLYTSTLNYMNDGLTNRVSTTVASISNNNQFTDNTSSTTNTKSTATTTTNSDNILLNQDFQSFVNSILNLSYFLNYLKGTAGYDNNSNSFNSLNRTSQDFSDLLKSFYMKIVNQGIQFKALIPISLKLTFEGISGFIIGQIFTVTNQILPSDYYSKNFGYIITGINNQIAPDKMWETVLDTQFCLLDNDINENKSTEVYEKYGLITLDNINQEVLLLSAENAILNDLANYIFNILISNNVLQSYTYTNIRTTIQWAIDFNKLLDFFNKGLFTSSYQNTNPNYILNLDLFNISKVNNDSYRNWINNVIGNTNPDNSGISISGYLNQINNKAYNIFNIGIIYNQLSLDSSTLFNIPVLISGNTNGKGLYSKEDCLNSIKSSLTALQSSSTPLITPKTQ